MNLKLKSFIVSSADWEVEVDEQFSDKAAISGLIFVLNKYGNKLLLSTTIMVLPKESFINQSIHNADFFATHKILNKIGFNSMAESLLRITNNLDEIKNIKQ